MARLNHAWLGDGALACIVLYMLVKIERVVRTGCDWRVKVSLSFIRNVWARVCPIVRVGEARVRERRCHSVDL